VTLTLAQWSRRLCIKETTIAYHAEHNLPLDFKRKPVEAETRFKALPPGKEA
jgi:hypothetical protein